MSPLADRQLQAAEPYGLDALATADPAGKWLVVQEIGRDWGLRFEREAHHVIDLGLVSISGTVNGVVRIRRVFLVQKCLAYRCLGYMLEFLSCRVGIVHSRHFSSSRNIFFEGIKDLEKKLQGL
jgi:hypothetical protein